MTMNSAYDASLINAPPPVYPSFQVPVPDFPAEESSPTRQVLLAPEIFIEQSDFLEEQAPGFRRLTPTQPVGIRYAGVILTVKEVHKVLFFLLAPYAFSFLCTSQKLIGTAPNMQSDGR